jgi:hypothetical protein
VVGGGFTEEGLDGFEDAGKNPVMDAADSGEIGGVIDKDVFEERIGRCLIHEPVAGKVAHVVIHSN